MADADREIRGWGGGGGRGGDRGVGGGGAWEWSPKKFISALRASVWSRNKGDPRAPAGLDPPLHLQQLKGM